MSNENRKYTSVNTHEVKKIFLINVYYDSVFQICIYGWKTDEKSSIQHVNTLKIETDRNALA